MTTYINFGTVPAGAGEQIKDAAVSAGDTIEVSFRTPDVLQDVAKNGHLRVTALTGTGTQFYCVFGGEKKGSDSISYSFMGKHAIQPATDYTASIQAVDDLTIRVAVLIPAHKGNH